MTFPPNHVLIGGFRPAGHPEHLPYVCMKTGHVCVDKLPVTDKEMADFNKALDRLTSHKTSHRPTKP
jgi:hypothetical protein